MKLSGSIIIRFDGSRVEVGSDPSEAEGTVSTPQCWKNIDMEQCPIDVIKTIAIGKAISRAGDDFAMSLNLALTSASTSGNG